MDGRKDCWRQRSSKGSDSGQSWNILRTAFLTMQNAEVSRRASSLCLPTFALGSWVPEDDDRLDKLDRLERDWDQIDRELSRRRVACLQRYYTDIRPRETRAQEHQAMGQAAERIRQNIHLPTIVGWDYQDNDWKDLPLKCNPAFFRGTVLRPGTCPNYVGSQSASKTGRTRFT